MPHAVHAHLKVGFLTKAGKLTRADYKGIMATLHMAPLAVIPYMANTAETAAQQRKRMIMVVSVLAGIIVVLLLVHFFVSPLDVLWFRGLRKMDNIVGE